MKNFVSLFVLASLSALLGTACATQEPANYDSKIEGEASLIRGLKRQGPDSSYVSGTIVVFQLLLTEEADLRMTYKSSAGWLRPEGDMVQWQLPEGDKAQLMVDVVRVEDGARASGTFTFALTPPGSKTAEEPFNPFFAVPAAAVGTITTSPDSEGRCDLEIDSSDIPHVVFRSHTHPSLWHATFENGAWQTELVDGMGFDIGGSVDTTYALALDSSGNPHIAYRYTDGEIRYATKSGNSWILEAVSSGAYQTFGQAVSIALDPANGQRPTIMWTTSTVDEIVILAYRSGTDSWTEQLGPNGPSGDDRYFQGAFAFQNDGTAWYSFGGDQTLRVEIDSWSASGGFTSSPVTTEYYTAPTDGRARITFDSSNQPVVMHNRGIEHYLGSTWNHSEIEHFTLELFDIAWNGDRPAVALIHGSALELVTPNNRGYWLYTEVADGVTNDDIGIAVDTSGNAHICYTSSGDVLFY